MAKRKSKQEELLRLPDKFWVFAADLSLRRPGFCKILVNRNGDDVTMSEIKTTNVDNKTSQKSHGQLLDEIMKAFAFFCPDDGVPVYFVRERAFNARAAQTEIGIYKVVGVMDWLLYRLRLEWAEFYPVTVKKLVTGSGKSTKQEVADMLSNYMQAIEFPTDDESDAAAVAVSFLIQNNILQTKGDKDDN